MDARLQEVLLDYGLEGYGLYWYCIELITSKVTSDNLTFELEHDARIIARNTGATVQKVEEMMRRLVEIGLFENLDGRITCMKLAKRLDKSMTNSPQMRKFIDNLRLSGNVMTLSDNVSPEGEGEGEGEHNNIVIQQAEIDQSESQFDIEDQIERQSKTDSNAHANVVIGIYNVVKANSKPNWSAVEVRTKTRIALIKKRIQNVENRIGSKDQSVINKWFEQFLEALAENDFYSGKPSPTNRGYKWSFDSLFREKNFVAAIERLNDES